MPRYRSLLLNWDESQPQLQRKYPDPTMFYVVLFSLLAVLLVVVGVVGVSRRRRRFSEADNRTSFQKADRQKRKTKRAQSRHDRRKRH